MTTLAYVAAMLAALAAAVALPGPAALPPAKARRQPQPDRSDGSLPVRAGAAGVAGLGALLLLGGVPGIVVGCVLAALTWRLLSRMEAPAVRRRRERLAAALPHVVDLMASTLAVGLSPASALQRVADAVDPPMSEELAALDARLRLGVDPVSVWRELAADPQLGALGRCIGRAVDSGASVADAMHRLADDLREEMRAGVESRARAVGVKAAAPLGLCLLPAFVLVGVVPLVAGSVALFTAR